MSLVLVFLLSLVEVSTTRMSRVALRVLSERERARGIKLLDRAAQDRVQFLLPLQFAVQGLTVAMATLVTWAAVVWQLSYPLVWSFLIMVGVIALFRQLTPRWLTQQNPESFLLTLLPLLGGLYVLFSWLSLPLLWPLNMSRRMLEEDQGNETEEISEEEIQAYLDVGEEDGIFEGEETELIQSALEFGSTLVREIMTPRSEIVMIPHTATVSQLKDLIVASKHSRIPVYRDRTEQIVGVVYVRYLIAVLGEGKGDDPITPLIKKPWFVPETKLVASLLKEMQRNSDPMAIVVNEYGSVSGLVTIEDLVEEIVGEIYDEDESQIVSIEAEEGGSFLALGSLEIGDLEEALNVDFGEPSASTVSGMVVEHLGKVPTPGETIVLGEVAIEILESDQKKIHRMRIRRLDQVEGESNADSSSPEPQTAEG